MSGVATDIKTCCFIIFNNQNKIMLEILVLLPIPILALMSIEDLKYKAVSDDINYFFLIYTYLLLAFLHFLRIISLDIKVIVSLLAIFIVLHLIKAFAIGDMIVFIWLTPYLSLLGFNSIINFYLFLFTVGIVNSLILSTIYLRKYRKNKYKYSLILSILSLVSAAIIFYSVYTLKYVNVLEYKDTLKNIIIAYILYLIVFIIYKINIDKSVRNILTFVRTPNELVEGDWIKNEIKVKNIPENLRKKVENLFIVEESNDNTVILRLKYNSIFRSVGLTKKHIEILKELHKHDKNLRITVYEGFPFIPAILIAYVITLIIYYI